MENLGSSLKISDKGLFVGTCELDRKCVVYASDWGQKVFDAPVEPILPCVCVCVCVCVFIKLHITTQSGPVILVILCHSHGVCVCIY